MSRRRTIRILGKKSPVLVIAWLIFLALGQHYHWFDEPKQAAIVNQPGLYHVTQVFDGDTIAINMNGKEEKVRMIGVDTPETHDPRKVVQCFGVAASNFTHQLLENKDVRLEADPLSTNRDRYDRLLRYVYTQDNKFVEQELIQQGYGFAYLGFPFTKSDQFRTWQQEARDNNRGLWNSCTPTTNTNGGFTSNPAQ